MSLVNLLAIVAVVALVVARQFKAQQIRTGGRKWLVVPVVLAVMALREPRLLDPDHATVAALLIGVELVVGVLMGVGWALTSRIRTGPDGTVWSKGTRATAAVWGVGIAARLGLMGLGVLLGVHQGTGALLLALAATLLVRGGLLAQRARALQPSNGPAASYGDHMATAPWKDRV
ncbi:DUF1453 domain-containing protein [Streptomyces sp. NBC_01429]|uniref:DUF1453 domain-containing protein n=1 Tax=Streptomyces sp. NBC_01429 TaxID=2903862 RepID=UPI002E280CA9|nr:DUF1453 domain-containing protein [Streptomyces sp. NBC_01429]